ncbi:MAG: hypothetical protein SNH63_07555 [Rikenellaceae bacterium]
MKQLQSKEGAHCSRPHSSSQGEESFALRLLSPNPATAKCSKVDA